MGFSIADIQRGVQSRPQRLIVYGQQKVGKSTFAAGAPGCIFVPTEEGTDALDVASFPLCKSFDDLKSALGTLCKEDHGFQTVVIDSLDWAERLIWDHTAKRLGKDSIEDIGYGKGYIEALTEWRQLLRGLDWLRDNKGMSIVVICHAQAVRITPPDGEAFDVYALKLHKHAMGVAQEWADLIGFAKLKQIVKKEDLGFDKKHRRAVSVAGERELILGHNPAYVSGNRWGLDTLPLDWSAYEQALEEARSSRMGERTTTPPEEGNDTEEGQ